MEHFLQTAGAVNVGSFIQLRVDAGQCRHIDDGVPAKFLPDIGDPDERPEGGLRHQRGHLLKAQHSQNLIDDAVGGKHIDEDTGQHHPRNKVGECEHGLEKLLDPGLTDLVEQNRHDDGHREVEDQPPQTENQGVLKGTSEFTVGEHLPEVLEARPRTVPKAGIIAVIPEGQRNAAHG